MALKQSCTGVTTSRRSAVCVRYCPWMLRLDMPIVHVLLY